MIICEPKRGFRQVDITDQRTKIEFAQCMKHIADIYPQASVIRVVLDNVNSGIKVMEWTPTTLNGIEVPK